jgi:hypothetical protein
MIIEKQGYRRIQCDEKLKSCIDMTQPIVVLHILEWYLYFPPNGVINVFETMLY